MLPGIRYWPPASSRSTRGWRAVRSALGPISAISPSASRTAWSARIWLGWAQVMRLALWISMFGQNPSEHLSSRGPLEKLAHPRPAQPALAVHDQRAAQEHLLREPGEFPSLIQVVIGAVVGVGLPVGQAPRRIPHDQVGIRARQEIPLAGIETEDPGWIGAGEGYELLRGQAPLHNTLGPQHGQSVAHARQAVGDLGEVRRAQFFARDGDRLPFVLDRAGAVVEEGAVIGADREQMPTFQSRPQGGVVRLGAQRRRAHPARPVGPLQQVLREE